MNSQLGGTFATVELSVPPAVGFAGFGMYGTNFKGFNMVVREKWDMRRLELLFVYGIFEWLRFSNWSHSRQSNDTTDRGWKTEYGRNSSVSAFRPLNKCRQSKPRVTADIECIIMAQLKLKRFTPPAAGCVTSSEQSSS
jgi:hypothetical protein